MDGEEKKCIQNFSVMTAQKKNAWKTKGGWESNIKINKFLRMGGIQNWTDWGICSTKGFIISDVQPSVLIPGSWSFNLAESVSHNENVS